MSQLREKYYKKVRHELQKKLGYKNIMQVPFLHKIVISMGIAEALKDKNVLQDHASELASIAGQKPVVTKAKKAISNFKLRKDNPIGLMVTLRGKRMFDFLDRFANIIAPRISDFRGCNKAGDKQGNYTFGVPDQQIFPELNLDLVKRRQGMNITFVTSATTDEECRELLGSLGFPFKK
ncbi:MAG: 50S ribosomal protein L5 [Chlamydiota bacterium]